MKEWKGEEKEEAHPLLKRVIRQALLEVLSRLNGAMEGNNESITSLSPRTVLLSVFLPSDLANISPSVSLFFSCPDHHLHLYVRMRHTVQNACVTYVSIIFFTTLKT